MTEAEQIILLKEKLEKQRIQYYKTVDEWKKDKEKLSIFKKMIERNSKEWYTQYLQNSLSLLERQYQDLQDDFHALNARHNHEMAKRQYIFPNNAEKIPKVVDPFAHTEYEQI